MILDTSAFWLVRVENILMIFQSMYEAGRCPVSTYPGWLRFALIFLVPVAFAVTVPTQALTGRLGMSSLSSVPYKVRASSPGLFGQFC
jgi:ABC-2 type transport system permease protein